MEKRFQMSSEGIIISALIVLTPSEQEKLECKDLEKAITRIAKNLKVDWAIETSGNISTATISKTYGPVVGEAQAHEVEMAASSFMSAVEKLQIRSKQLVKPQDAVNDTVIAFTVGNNAARVIKALRECTQATLDKAKQCAMKGRLVCNHDEAIKLMDHLDIAGATDVHIDTDLSHDLNFCNEALADWDDPEGLLHTMGAVIMYGTKGDPIGIPCGRICERTLKNMFIAYVESM